MTRPKVSTSRSTHDSEAMMYAQVIEEIRGLGHPDRLRAMIEEAHKPRSHPDYPGIEVKRLNPTSYIEGYSAAIVEVMSIITAAETRALQEAEGGR